MIQVKSKNGWDMEWRSSSNDQPYRPPTLNYFLSTINKLNHVASDKLIRWANMSRAPFYTIGALLRVVSSRGKNNTQREFVNAFSFLMVARITSSREFFGGSWNQTRHFSDMN